MPLLKYNPLPPKVIELAGNVRLTGEKVHVKSVANMAAAVLVEALHKCITPAPPTFAITSKDFRYVAPEESVTESLINNGLFGLGVGVFVAVGVSVAVEVYAV